jgi:hypothetical protein
MFDRVAGIVDAEDKDVTVVVRGTEFCPGQTQWSFFDGSSNRVPVALFS